MINYLEISSSVGTCCVLLLCTRQCTGRFVLQNKTGHSLDASCPCVLTPALCTTVVPWAFLCVMTRADIFFFLRVMSFRIMQQYVLVLDLDICKYVYFTPY